ncbi:MAG: phenylalanine--tRNA ligase subunit alpha, partial [Tenericutes bacterium]|nr:phenylalanine--tRNA ligase subunit alpha [Mycoplasmatota bacterium]
MKEKVNIINEELISDLENVKSLKDVADLKVKYFGKKGLVTELTSNMKDLSVEEKKELGKLANEVRTNVAEKISEVEKRIEKEELDKKLANDTIDITLPSEKIKRGSRHPFNRIIEDVEDFFVSMGYDVVDGPELETDENCFRRLNVPLGHPARDAQDTFYIDQEYLLRTQTSSVQARTMQSNEEKKPIRMICPGKVYRRDDDATHSHQFGRVEGLVIDKNISLADLKGTLELFAKKILCENTKVRFRP